MAPFDQDAHAKNGVVNTTNTSQVTGTFYAIQVLADCAFSAFAENGASGQSITGVTLPAGTVLYNGMGITSYTLSSGAVRAYKRMN